MARIRCHYPDCAYLDETYCSAAAVEIDPDAGCLTNLPAADAEGDEEWGEEEEEMEEWEEVEDEGEDDDSWLDDEDEEF